MEKSKRRQAIVVIHGIGEQRPLNTMRSLVKSLLSYERKDERGDQDVRDWVKPDRISKSYEMRKITAKKVEGKRSTTHFYEYHWAGKMTNSHASHVFRWLCSLLTMKRIFSKTTVTIKIVQILSVVLFGLWILFPVRITLEHLFICNHPFIDHHSLQWIFGLILPFLLSRYFLARIFIGYIGDAARYLRNDPSNIAQREDIRRDGIKFLKRLHKDGEYDRIILVGHSLGSVIAYDLLTYLWIDFNKSLKLPALPDKKIKKFSKNSRWHCIIHETPELEKTLDEICSASQSLIKQGQEIKDWKAIQQSLEFKTYRNKQEAFWNAIHTSKNKKANKDQKTAGWLISDLITLGSPLTHGNLLMSDSNEEFQRVKMTRQFPTCPPSQDPPPRKEIEKGKATDRSYYQYMNENNELFLNHGTPFFPTKWTNLYFNSDYIGGPINHQFGPGIKDIELKHNLPCYKFWKKLPLFTHGHYWSLNATSQNIKSLKEYLAIKELYKVMRLDDLERKVYSKN